MTTKKTGEKAAVLERFYGAIGTTDYSLTVNCPESGALAFMPEKALLLAIIQRAVADYLCLQEKTPAPGIHRISARKWLFSSSKDPMSFHWICAHFSDDPDMLKREILKQVKGRSFKGDLGLLQGLQKGSRGVG